MAYYYNTDFKQTVVGSGASLYNMFQTDVRDGKGKMVSMSGEDKIHESIRMILSTRVGERAFIPEFGSRLHLVVFEPNSLIARDLLKMYVKEALATWEKRIDVVDVFVGDIDDSNSIPITISYKFRNSNIYGSYVYPFNIKDGNIDVYSLDDTVTG